MRSLTQADFLALWETGRSLHPLDQGVLAVRTAFPEVQDDVADWPIGRRNRALAEVRCASFGTAFGGWTACRGCGEQLEFNLDGRSLMQMPAADSQASVTVQGQRYRLPTSRDLATVVDEPDPARAARRLLRQCCDSADVPESGWSDEQVGLVGDCMAEADPLAQILLGFDCPGCGMHFDESLDLPSFLWTEVEARATRLLLDVHVLASAYGWSEAEVLGLSPARRAVYLKMVQA
jgi:hypothetical protein